MLSLQEIKTLQQAVQENCQISDARDHGVYSMCSLVLKMRSQYKWQHDLPPWQEPESADLLAWIEERENQWTLLAAKEYQPLPLAQTILPAHDQKAINELLPPSRLYYGAGHGRAMKGIFFLAELRESRTVAGCPVVLLGTELARELESPFALLQDQVVVIRRHSLGYFLWDYFQELRNSCRSSVRAFFTHYRVLQDSSLNQAALQDQFATIVEEQLELFIHHELGELLQKDLPGDQVQPLIVRFPGSVVEYYLRAVQDLLADTHDQGTLAQLITKQNVPGLALYVSFLTGLREVLFPEIKHAWERFHQTRNWREIENAWQQGGRTARQQARRLLDFAEKNGDPTNDGFVMQFQQEFLAPLQRSQST